MTDRGCPTDSGWDLPGLRLGKDSFLRRCPTLVRPTACGSLDPNVHPCGATAPNAFGSVAHQRECGGIGCGMHTLNRHAIGCSGSLGPPSGEAPCALAANGYDRRPSQLGTLVRLVLAILPTLACSTTSQGIDATRFDGAWVLESESGPMAMRISDAGTPALSGSIVGAVGGRTQPFLEWSLVDGRLQFRVERLFDGGQVVGSDTVAWFSGGGLRGETVRDDHDGKRTWTGRRPDVIADVDGPEWTEGQPVALFDGGGLTEWNTGATGQVERWHVQDGILRNQGDAPEIVSNRRFWNFVLRVEYRVSEGGNSGIALRGRYEVQILDDFGTEPSIHGNGAVYSRIPPKVVASRRHGEWQELAIRLVGRVVTVVLNGVTIIDRQVIEGITAMASDARESQPGPIALQGDHGPIEFRQIVLVPLERP